MQWCHLGYVCACTNAITKNYLACRWKGSQEGNMCATRQPRPLEDIVSNLLFFSSISCEDVPIIRSGTSGTKDIGWGDVFSFASATEKRDFANVFWWWFTDVHQATTIHVHDPEFREGLLTFKQWFHRRLFIAIFKGVRAAWSCGSFLKLAT